MSYLRFILIDREIRAIATMDHVSLIRLRQCFQRHWFQIWDHFEYILLKDANFLGPF